MGNKRNAELGRGLLFVQHVAEALAHQLAKENAGDRTPLMINYGANMRFGRPVNGATCTVAVLKYHGEVHRLELTLISPDAKFDTWYGSFTAAVNYGDGTTARYKGKADEEIHGKPYVREFELQG